MKRQKRGITKKEVETIEPAPFTPVLSYVRFREGIPVPENHLSYRKPKEKREYIPGIGYTTKMRRQ